MARDSIEERVNRLELPFSAAGVDPYGVSKQYVAFCFRVMEAIYRRYLGVTVFGVSNIPKRGRAMLVGNHSGGVALDAAMVLSTSCFLEMEPPRLAQGMAEKFINRMPFASILASRTGQFTGLPEHAARLLEDDRLLVVFPEGARGTAKLYKERYSLVDFGTGFMRLALKTRTPIIPFAVLGGGEGTIPTIMNAYGLGEAVRGCRICRSRRGCCRCRDRFTCEIHYGEPLIFEGTGGEEGTRSSCATWAR